MEYSVNIANQQSQSMLNYNGNCLVVGTGVVTGEEYFIRY